MDIRVLNYFVTIVQTKSISNAANAMHITQPTLSRQIKDLEDELGTVLFHRGSREIQLTDDGQYLYNRSIEILALVEKTESNLKIPEEISGDIYIGMAESQSLDILAKAIKRLSQNHPKMTVHLRSGNADDILEHLNQGLLDFGVTFGGYDSRKYNHLEIPNRDKWGVLVPQNHPLARLKQLKIKDILDFPLIVSAQSSIDHSVLAGLGDYRIVATYNLLYNASLLVKEGVGIALCLDGIIDTGSVDSQLCFIPFSNQKFDSLQLIWKKHIKQDASSRKFLEIFEQTLQGQ